MARLSGLQRDVLSLYRKCLREIRKKPVVSSDLPNPRPIERKTLLICTSEQESRDNFKAYTRCVFRLVSIQESREMSQSLETKVNNGCRAEFQKNIFIGKKDFTAIEYFLRKGQRQLEMYSSPGIRNIR